MPMNFEWYIKVTYQGKTNERSDRHSCRENAAALINETVINTIAGGICQFCGASHSINGEAFSKKAKACTYEMGVDMCGDDEWLKSFLETRYPSVKTSLKFRYNWLGDSKLMFVTSGDHWAVNAWWWTTLYFRLLTYVPVKTYELLDLIKESNSGDPNIWYSPVDKEQHVAAYRKLMSGREKPLVEGRFHYGPISLG